MKNVKFASISDQLINTAIIMNIMFNTERIVKDMKGGKEDMTEKRFSVKKSGSGLYYRDGDYEIDNTIQFIIETIEMKLNQLSDENEQLKQELKRCRCRLNSDKNDYQLTLAFIKSKGYSLKDVVRWENE